MNRMHNVRMILSAVLLIGLIAVRADSGDSTRRIGTACVNNSLFVSFTFRDVFRKAVRSKLKSGLPTTVVLRLAVYGQGNSRPEAVFPRTCQIVYDLWEEDFLVDIKDPNGFIHKRVPTEQKAVDQCGILHHTPVARDIEKGTYFVKVIAEANPLSPELVRNIKKWLSRPHGSVRSRAPGENFFGSFLSIFVNQRLGTSEATVVFRSQNFIIDR